MNTLLRVYAAGLAVLGLAVGVIALVGLGSGPNPLGAAVATDCCERRILVVGQSAFPKPITATTPTRRPTWSGKRERLNPRPLLVG